MNLETKIKAILAEGSGVPGTDATLGTKQAETLKSSESQDGDGGKTAKIKAKYTTTKGEKLDDISKGGEVDPKAKEETAKINDKYVSGSQEKLKEEAFSALFTGETLTEEFQLKAKAIFEAAVEQVSEAKIEELQEEYQFKLDEAVEEVKGELVEQIDGYLEYVIEQWLQDNAVALESGIKVEMMSSFMENLKSVFEQHYIDVPESKVDVVEEQASHIEELEKQLLEAQELTQQADIEVQIMQAEAIIAEAQSGLTAIEAEKLYSLAENINFETKEEFKSKVDVLKESFFRKQLSADDKEISQEKAETVTESKHSDVEAVLKALRQDSKLIRSSN